MPRLLILASFVIGLLFVIAGIGMVATGASNGWPTLLFFGVCTAACAERLWPRLLNRQSSAEVPSAELFPGPLTLFSNPRKIVFLIILSAGFVGSFLWLLLHRQPGFWMSLALWPGVALFGLGLPVLVATLFKRAAIRLQGDGFVMTQLWRDSFIPWHKTSAFEVATIPPGNIKLVVFDQADAAGTVTDANVKLTGRTSGLPDNYGLSPDDLAALLNQWRKRAIAATEHRPVE